MDEQRPDDQLEPTYNNSVPIQDVALKRWTIEKSGGRGSGISVLMARHDDDDDDWVLCVIKYLDNLASKSMLMSSISLSALYFRLFAK